MASHNPSGKPDMMPFPGVHSVRREEASRKCRAISVAHLKKYCSCCLHLHKSCSQVKTIILFFAESELLARSYNFQKENAGLSKNIFTLILCVCYVKLFYQQKNGVLLPVLATTSANVSTVGMMNSRLVKKQTKTTKITPPYNKIRLLFVMESAFFLILIYQCGSSFTMEFLK